MNIFFLKLIITPSLMMAISLAARRWGPFLGGLLAGLPITSTTVMAFLALEQGPAFAVAVVPSALAGLAAVVCSYLAYLQVARRWHWALALTAAVLGFAFTCTLLQWAGSLWLSVLACLALVAIILPLAPARVLPASARPSRPWEIPARMIAATSLLLIITGGAPWWGPKVSGVLAPIPVIAWPLVVFSHLQVGLLAMASTVRGNALGALGVVAFYLVIWLGASVVGIWLALLLGVAASLLVTFGIVGFLRLRRR